VAPPRTGTTPPGEREVPARPAGPTAPPSVSGVDLEALVAAMAVGREAALEELYHATVGAVFALAQRILRIRADAEEVVCDTYSQAWETARQFDGRRAGALGWLLMICRSRALDRLRHARSRGANGRVDLDSVQELADGAVAAEDLLSALQEGSRARAALATLPPDRRQLVAMAFLEGLSHQEMADRTGLPLGTVKSHVRRALAQLRELLEAPP
jgi:RNA polymerase sigma-70 factor, ECF subfamily